MGDNRRVCFAGAGASSAPGTRAAVVPRRQLRGAAAAASPRCLSEHALAPLPQLVAVLVSARMPTVLASCQAEGCSCKPKLRRGFGA